MVYIKHLVEGVKSQFIPKMEQHLVIKLICPFQLAALHIIPDCSLAGGDGSEECHDYYILDETCVITYDNPQCQISIVIFDNFNAEDKEHFFILTSSNDTSRCRILDDNTTIHIVDDGECNPIPNILIFEYIVSKLPPHNVQRKSRKP